MKHKNKKWNKPFPRKLHIGQKEWSYKIFTSGIIGIKNPDCSLQHYIHATHIDINYGDMYFDDYGESREIAFLGPSAIKDFIIKNLLDKTKQILLKEPKQKPPRNQEEDDDLLIECELNYYGRRC